MCLFLDTGSFMSSHVRLFSQTSVCQHQELLVEDLKGLFLPDLIFILETPQVFLSNNSKALLQ